MPFRKEIATHINKVSTELKDLPRLEPTREYVQGRETEVLRTFIHYRSVLRQMFNLSEKEQQLIAEANENLGKPNSLKFLEELSPGEQSVFIDIVNLITDPEFQLYTQALQELHSKMQNGQAMADEGVTPGDGDTRSDAAIWGFTQIDPKYVETQLHFVTCHFIERFLTQVYRAEEKIFAHHKDWLLNAMTDVLIVQWTQHGRFKDVFQTWHRSKAEGGLGWISKKRTLQYSIFRWEQNLSPSSMFKGSMAIIDTDIAGSEGTVPQDFVDEALSSLESTGQITPEDRPNWYGRSIVYSLYSPLFVSLKPDFQEKRAELLRAYPNEEIKWYQDERTGDVLILMRRK